MTTKRPYTLAELEAARDKAALFVAVHGAVYLPWFESLDAEFEAASRENSTLDRAYQIAQKLKRPNAPQSKKIATQNATQAATQNATR